MPARHQGQHPVELEANRARQGITGVHLRYILGFGIAGAVIAFLFVAIAD
jgi:hypothetical protein